MSWNSSTSKCFRRWPKRSANKEGASSCPITSIAASIISVWSHLFSCLNICAKWAAANLIILCAASADRSSSSVYLSRQFLHSCRSINHSFQDVSAAASRDSLEHRSLRVSIKDTISSFVCEPLMKPSFSVNRFLKLPDLVNMALANAFQFPRDVWVQSVSRGGGVYAPLSKFSRLASKAAVICCSQEVDARLLNKVHSSLHSCSSCFCGL